VHLFDFPKKLSAPENIVIDLIEASRGCEPRTRKSGQRVEVKAIYGFGEIEGCKTE
jgi:hypothetical protein